MEGQEPPKVVRYPRPHLDVEPRKLELLRDAYFGCYWLVGGTVIVGLGGQFLGSAAITMIGESARGFQELVVWTVVVLMLGVNLLIAYRCSTKIAQAKERGTGYALCLALLATVLTPCCLGLVGCAVIQQAAASEFKRSGIRSGFLGVKRQDVQARIDEARKMEEALPFSMP